MIKIKRIYSAPSQGDGYRVLVDRLWPRGISKEMARIDLWLREIAPSDELRVWYSHDPKKWDEFKRKYCIELSAKVELVKSLKWLEREKGTITFLYSSTEGQLNNAVALQEYLAGVG